MAFSIKEFSAEVRKRGMHSPSLFYFEFVSPNIMLPTVDKNNATNLIGLLCNSANIPGRQFFTHDGSDNKAFELGQRRNAVYNIQTNQLDLSFYVDQQNIIPAYFNLLSERMISTKNGFFGYYDDYKISSAKLLILQHTDKKEEKEAMVVDFKDLVLKSISNVELTWENGNAVTRLNVTLDYARYEISNRFFFTQSPGEDFGTIPANAVRNSNLLGSPAVRKLIDTVGRKAGFGKVLDIGYIANNVLNNNVDILFNRGVNPITGK
ncbi:MAG TPA: hypothetical protein V6C58_16995 [Allocoleopsis sp.]